ncbi:hypothetical protein SLW56_08960 [Xanthomonas sp. LF07-6]|uniref:hypothetical protein n=1 Tax=Xanthomonas sp. LF07-6 TaxID=3097550 RepID=UPI002A8368A1|nr:hypothetical protein [Xanthomonas sp. LF07-6]MDY4339903.1 hypothetical protein [Xanthomonas sp. LF07-6]
MAAKDSGTGPTVFWSWQSDYDEKNCRYFVRDALQEALKKVGDSMELEPADRPSLDHDTKGARGMVDIKSTILKKIARCSLFVADLTPIGKTAKGKLIPNPNVLIELGWAMHAPGEEFILGVLNKASGCVVDDLPFDIRGRRVVQYDLAPTATSGERKAELMKLVPLLQEVIEEELKLQLESAESLRRELATSIEGVESNTLDPSVWRLESGLVRHEEFGRPVSIYFADGPRAYIRVIPAPHSTRGPSLSAFEQLKGRNTIAPESTGCSSGSFGGAEDGYIQYWWNGKEPREVRNATMYFEESGEIWSFNGGGFYRDNQERLMIPVPTMLREFYRILKAALEIQDALGWPGARKVEVGFVSQEVPYFHLSTGEKKMGRKTNWNFEESRGSWTSEAVESFSIDMVQSLFSVFSVPPPDAAQVKNLLVVS